tara:strand:+ start:792 stop:902 length:111 start_codon:yes stop_codon:yes gene_type:complete
MDKDIERMTIVYTDGTMVIFVRNLEGHLVPEIKRWN